MEYKCNDPTLNISFSVGGAFGHILNQVYLSDDVLEVKIPETVRYIGEFAFHNRTKVEKIILPKDLYEIGTGAFLNCINLKEIIVPNETKRIYSGAFENCIRLNSIKILNTSCFIHKENVFIRTPYNMFYNKFIEIFATNDNKIGNFLSSHISELIIKFINNIDIIEINKDINNLINYVDNTNIKMEDVIPFLDNTKFNGLKTGINYGI